MLFGPFVKLRVRPPESQCHAGIEIARESAKIVVLRQKYNQVATAPVAKTQGMAVLQIQNDRPLYVKTRSANQGRNR